MGDKVHSKAPLPLAAARALALHAQALDQPPSAKTVNGDAIYNLIVRLGCLQIDTLHVVHRSHYLVLWSRLGVYDPQILNQLAYAADDRRLFEYWKHAACLLPLEEYRYAQPAMRWRLEDGGAYRRAWIDEPENQALVNAVLERIRVEGGLRTADFDDPRAVRGTWWDWKPAKHALEYLFDIGQLMVSKRINFQRVYDLAERVLPEWVDQRPSTMEESNRFRIEQAARALGICHPQHTADYAYLRRGLANEWVPKLIEAGIVQTVQVELSNGLVEDWIIHRDHLKDLEAAADGALVANHTTFLSPFDSLFWAKGRDEALWGFRQMLEAYKPEPTREWGYFCLPILHHDRLVGRFDPSMDRKNRVLTIKALYLEPGIQDEDHLIDDVAAALRSFMAFHGAQDLVINRSNSESFGARLLAEIK